MRISVIIAAMLSVLLPLIGSTQTANPKYIEAAKKHVPEALRDPASVRFLSTEVKVAPNAKGEPTTVVCGKLSARNGFGGMSAAAPFVYLVELKSTYIADESITVDGNASIASMAYARFCLGIS